MMSFGPRPIFAVMMVLAVACDQDPVTESADLRRPAGMAYVVRDTTRTDLLLVDSEAQGVRIRQFSQTDEGRTDGFIPSPVVFFPLVIPAPGYPTRLAVSEDGTNAFVIAPVEVGQMLEAVQSATSVLHILDVADTGFGARVTPEDHIRLGGIDLSAIGGSTFIPVDVYLVGGRRIAIAFDELGSANGKILIVTVPEAATLNGELLGETELRAAGPYDEVAVPGGVRRIIVRRVGDTGPPMLYATSPDQVILEIDVDTLTTRILNTGGPTHDLIDAKELGLIALRTDRPSAVVFVGDPLERSTLLYRSPFTDPLDRATASATVADAIGRIDLRPGALGPGAYAPTINGLSFDSDPDKGLIGPKDGRAVMITHINGVATFLTETADGTGLELGISQTASVAAVWRGAGGPGLGIAQCDANIVGEAGDATVICDPSIVVNEVSDDRRYRATFNGALVRSNRGRLTVTGTETGTRARTGVEITDSSGIALASRLIDPDSPRERIRLTMPIPEGCDADDLPTGIRDLTVEGTLTTGSSGNRIKATLDEPLPDPIVCGAVDTAAVVDLYEIFPAGREGVLVRTDDRGIFEVLERVQGVAADATTIDFGAQNLALGQALPIRFTLTDTTLVCTPAAPTAELGATCASNDECAPGWSCDSRGDNDASTPDPLRRCVAKCGSDRCMVAPFDRGCSGLELTVAQTLAAEVDIKSDSIEPNATVRSAAPDDAIALEAQKSFIVSFPGARSVVEVIPGTTGIVVDQLR